MTARSKRVVHAELSAVLAHGRGVYGKPEPETCDCRASDCSYCMKQPGPLIRPVPEQRVLYADD